MEGRVVLVKHGARTKMVKNYILELLYFNKEATRKEITDFLKGKMGKDYTPSILTHCINVLKSQDKIISVSRGIYAINKDYVPEAKRGIQYDCIDILEKTKDDLIGLAKGVSQLTITPAEKKAVDKIRQAVSELETMKQIFK